MKALLYCPNGRPYLLKDVEEDKIFIGLHNYGSLERHASDTDLGMNLEYERLCCKTLNGKIVAECDYDVEEIKLNEYEYEDYNNSPYWYSFFETQTLKGEELHKQSCLTYDELDEYLDIYKEKEVYGYAIHISNLDTYIDPKEINDYVKGDWIEYSNGLTFFRPEAIEHVPKSMTFVWCKENGDQYLFIPVHPELLCKILNGECTIIVKKKVLKGMNK